MGDELDLRDIAARDRNKKSIRVWEGGDVCVCICLRKCMCARVCVTVSVYVGMCEWLVND